MFRESRRTIDRVWLDHAPSFTTPIVLHDRFPDGERSGLVLGNTPQKMAYGRQAA
jgi:hypothetical protein